MLNRVLPIDNTTAHDVDHLPLNNIAVLILLFFGGNYTFRTGGENLLCTGTLNMPSQDKCTAENEEQNRTGYILRSGQSGKIKGNF